MLETISATFTSILAGLGITPSHLFAGLAGALVRTVIQGKRLTWEIASAALVGSFCAIYLTPLAATWLGIAALNIAAHNGLAFAIGLLGLSLAEGAFKLVNRWAANPRLPTEISAKGLAEALQDPHDEAQEEERKTK